jgi:type II secretory pathway component PulF
VFVAGTTKVPPIQQDAQGCVEDGRPLAQAFAKYVDPISAHLFVIAEDAGVLSTALRSYVERERSRKEWRQNVFKTVSYPVFLLLACYALGIYVLITVRPELTALELTINGAGPTLIQRVTNYIPVCLLCMLTAIPLLYGIGRMIKARTNVALRLPFDVLLTRTYSERFIYGLYIQVQAGIPLIEALSAQFGIASERKRMTSEYELVLDGVLRGLPLSETLPSSLDPVCRQFIQMGEQTGDMEKALERTCQYLKARVDHALDRIAMWLEPIVMGVMGIVVASTMYSVFVPMYQSVGGTMTK